MNKLLALFPSISLKEPCTLWGIEFMSFNSSPLAVLYYKDKEGEKLATRQLEILRCHLMVAAYIAGKDQLQISSVIKLQHEREEIAFSNEEDKVSLSFLTGYLPKDLEKTAQTICWFAHYLEQPLDNERGRIFRIYNALGTLSGGFNDILEVSSKQKDLRLLKTLLNRVDDFHAGDNEDENYVYKTKALSDEELKALESIYLASEQIRNMKKNTN